MKLYYITLNDNLLFSGLSKEALDIIIAHTDLNYRYKFDGEGGLSGRNADTMLIFEDTLVNYQYDSEEDECGWSAHTIITSLEGETLLDEKKGDWTNRLPDANFSSKQIRGKVALLGL